MAGLLNLLVVIDAYEVLDREAALGSGGVAAGPGADREPFDPQATYEAASDEVVSFGSLDWGPVLAPLRTMSFWKMKDRMFFCLILIYLIKVVLNYSGLLRRRTGNCK